MEGDRSLSIGEIIFKDRSELAFFLFFWLRVFLVQSIIGGYYWFWWKEEVVGTLRRVLG
jgi:hypothetical protein